MGKSVPSLAMSVDGYIADEQGGRATSGSAAVRPWPGSC